MPDAVLADAPVAQPVLIQPAPHCVRPVVVVSARSERSLALAAEHRAGLLETGTPPEQVAALTWTQDARHASHRLAVYAEGVRMDPGAASHSGRQPQHPLVTGVTGFIGCFLAARLLDAGATRVFGLVRAPGRREGLRRIRATLEHYRLWKDSYAGRIIPVVGDLTQPRFGLNRPSWDHLAMVTDAIYHSGADVNFVRPCATLKAAHVLGTADVLRLAGQFSVKPVHYMSTSYVYDRFLTGALPLDEWPEGDVDCSNVEAGLAGSGIQCHPVDSSLVASYDDHFVATGVMPEPTTPRKEHQL